MKRLALAAALCLVLTACGGNDEPDTASDPAPAPSTGSTPTPTPTPTPTEPTPSEPYPDFEPTDYEFLLATSCYCPDAGTPIRVTVVADEVARAVLARDGTGRGGGKKGDPAPEYLWVTIDDIIDRANEATANGAATVTVDWPSGQDHPDNVYIDESEMMADEEVGYTISDVVVS